MKLKVKALDCVIMQDPEGFLLDISHSDLEKRPEKIYEIPDTVFWRRVIASKRLELVGATGPEEKPKEAAKGNKGNKEGGAK